MRHFQVIFVPAGRYAQFMNIDATAIRHASYVPRFATPPNAQIPIRESIFRDQGAWVGTLWSDRHQIRKNARCCIVGCLQAPRVVTSWPSQARVNVDAFIQECEKQPVPSGNNLTSPVSLIWKKHTPKRKKGSHFMSIKNKTVKLWIGKCHHKNFPIYSKKKSSMAFACHIINKAVIA